MEIADIAKCDIQKFMIDVATGKTAPDEKSNLAGLCNLRLPTFVIILQLPLHRPVKAYT